MTKMPKLTAAAANDDQPISKDGVEDLILHSLTVMGHAKTLRYLVDDLQVKFGNGKDADKFDVEQIVSVLEFVTLELEDAAGKAQTLVFQWGGAARRAKRDAKKEI